jgi:hypothetical protein
MPEMPRYFTLDQANAVVVLIQPLVKEILQIREAILDRQPEVWPVVESAAGNGGSKEASEVALEFQRLDGLIREVMATGALMKDINHGVLDFLAKREGKDIYLCWKYGENEITFWHDIEGGYSGRQNIDLES